MEDFVSFEISRKLKEEGFVFRPYEFYSPYLNDTTAQIAVPAPRIDQVKKWLRSKGYHVYAELCYKSTKTQGTETINNRWYSFCVSNIRTCECYGDDREFETCEEAEEAAIKYVLDNVL